MSFLPHKSQDNYRGSSRKNLFAAFSLRDNRGMAAKELTGRQKKVLGWIVDGCTGAPPYEAFKNTARMLEGHKLVKISGHGDKWKAVATKRGERVYAGTEPLVVNRKRRKNADAKESPVPSTLKNPRPTPEPAKPEVDLTPYIARIRQGIGESDLDVFQSWLRSLKLTTSGYLRLRNFLVIGLGCQAARSLTTREEPSYIAMRSPDSRPLLSLSSQ